MREVVEHRDTVADAHQLHAPLDPRETGQCFSSDVQPRADIQRRHRCRDRVRHVVDPGMGPLHLDLAA